MACSPGEYGTATSIRVFSKYLFLLLKRSPPRDMSSQVTMSSVESGRRTQALKFTRVRACFRRFSRSFAGTSFVATRALGDASAGAFGVATSEDGGVTGLKVGAAPRVSVCIQAAPANADGLSFAPPGLSAPRHGPGGAGPVAPSPSE